MTSLTEHKITDGTDNNTFQFELEDIMIILKSHQIKLSHNLNTRDEKANIASFTELAFQDEPNESMLDMANIAGFNGSRPKSEICFRPRRLDL